MYLDGVAFWIIVGQTILVVDGVLSVAMNEAPECGRYFHIERIHRYDIHREESFVYPLWDQTSA